MKKRVQRGVRWAELTKLDKYTNETIPNCTKFQQRKVGKNCGNRLQLANSCGILKQNKAVLRICLHFSIILLQADSGIAKYCCLSHSGGNITMSQIYVPEKDPILNEVLSAYAFPATLLGAVRYGQGHINDTFCVLCQPQEGDCIRYILQGLSSAAPGGWRMLHGSPRRA